MPQLIDNGYIYIAQPPLYRAKRGKGETYIKDDRDLEIFLIQRAAEARRVTVNGSADAVSGDDLVRLLQKLIDVPQADADRSSAAAIRATSSSSCWRARCATSRFFADAHVPRGLCRTRLRRDDRSVTILADEEHNLFQLQIEDRSTGYPRRHAMTADFLTTGEYRQLLALQRRAGVPARPVRRSPRTPARRRAEGEEPPGTNEAAAVERTAAGPRSRRDTCRSTSIDELVEYFIAAGKKGIAINRYKGLGEMNPEQLWDTTMKPEVRTLLQVRAEDHAEADLMFTTLMGDQVEPRRKFIEDNALDVKNLDV